MLGNEYDMLILGVGFMLVMGYGVFTLVREDIEKFFHIGDYSK